MSKKHSASLEMIAYLKKYASKRAERKEYHADIACTQMAMTYEQKLQILKQRLEMLETKKHSDLLALADELAPKTPDDDNIIIFPIRRAA